MESTRYAEAKRLLRENIDKIVIYECCLNMNCVNQKDIWEKGRFSNTNLYYTTVDEKSVSLFSGDEIIADVAVKREGKRSPVAVIEILHPDRTKTTDRTGLYSVFNVGMVLNMADIILVEIDDIFLCAESNTWRLQNRMQYRTCGECFKKLI